MTNGGRDGRETTEEGHGWRDVGMVGRFFWGADHQDVVVVQSVRRMSQFFGVLYA